MADSMEKQLIAAFCTAWGEVTAPLLGCDSALSPLALREVSGEGIKSALAVAATWSSGFVAECSGALPGVLICLFKSEDSRKLEGLVKQAVDGLPKPGARALVGGTLANLATHLARERQGALVFGEVKYLDLGGQEARLADIVGNQALVATLSLTIGDEADTQALLLYAPDGSLQRRTAEARPAASNQRARREEPLMRNLERLLGIELEVIVRFGTTQMPLRDVVRLGTGMMIELNRGVDEPVELLVNGRPLARGEVVVVDGYYGVRITEIGSENERPLSLISAGGQV
jgi:flagellar motor switch protein FliN